MEYFLPRIDISSVQIMKTLVFVFFKLALFTIVVRLIAIMVPPSSQGGCVVGRVISLFPGALFSWWYVKSFMTVFQSVDEVEKILVFLCGMGVNILIIRAMFPKPQKTFSEGGDDKNGKQKSLPENSQK